MAEMSVAKSVAVGVLEKYSEYLGMPVPTDVTVLAAIPGFGGFRSGWGIFLFK